jgi:ABC-type transport system involved in multi-copper enzyme maturation permease subunit
MKPILLIALNFIREQRWPLIVLIIWVLGSSMAAGFGTDKLVTDDVIFFLKTQAIYGIAFIAFLSASAIYNERKSRRILAVLSKGISRSAYLLGLLLGVLIAGAVYCLAMGGTGGLMFRNAGLPQDELWRVILVLMTSFVVTSTVAMFFATFLSPLFSTVATAFALGTPAIAAHIAGGPWSRILPVYYLMDSILNFSVNTAAGWETFWGSVFWALVDSAVLWLIASWLFSYRDVAVPIE